MTEPRVYKQLQATVPNADTPAQTANRRSCTACDVVCPNRPVGWWRNALLVICPHCYALLTVEDHTELGTSLQPLEERYA